MQAFAVGSTYGRLTCTLGLALVMLQLVPTTSVEGQDLPTGEWAGMARFTDGIDSSWQLHLWRGSEGVRGDLYFGAGRGAELRAISFDGNRLTFRMWSEGIPERVSCDLELTAISAWVGSCEDPAARGEVQLDPVPPGTPLSYADDQTRRPRARDVGLVVGVFPTGPHNAITDVDGVRVGHATVLSGDDIRTGVTAIVPAPGDLYANPVPAWIHTVNGYGKLIGQTQVNEFGEIETPILLTCTLCVWSAARALAWSLMDADAGLEHTINPVVGETNDSWVNDMWQDPVQPRHVQEALQAATTGPVQEGSVGAGTGTGAFGWKGGIGTSSRVLPVALGRYTVGVLVQTNFGGTLTINGAPVGRELGSFSYRAELADTTLSPSTDREDGGSLMIVVATDAPLTPITLDRLAQRAILGAARTGSFAHNSSGDYVIAFSTAERSRRERFTSEPHVIPSIPNPQMSPLFAAVAEATEEAIYNAMFTATTVRARGRVYKALPLDGTLEILRRYGALDWNERLPIRR